MKNKKQIRRQKIRQRIRKRISGNTARPRLSVFRSNRDIYVQMVDDENGRTLLSVSSRDKDFADKKATKVEISKLVGKVVAERAREAGIEEIVFDRGGYLYHGRVKALAEGAREGGLKF